MAQKSKTWHVIAAVAILGAAALPALAIDKTDNVIKTRSTIETTVDGFGYDDYRVSFAAGKTANIVVQGDDSSDLDLFVYNAKGEVVCSDEDGTDDMVCSWVAKGGNYTIRIRNLGRHNRYLMEYY